MTQHTDIMETVLAVTAAGARPLQKQFALERIDRARAAIAAKLDGTSALATTDLLEALDLDLAYVAGQVESIR